MKLPKHANIVIYIISLVIPVVLTAILAFFTIMGDYNYVSKTNKEADIMTVLYLAVPAIVTSFCVLMLIPLLTLSILHLIQVYRIWNVINDGQSRMTPGKAIGFLFIPVFSIYWIFQVWSGFPADYNAFVDRYRLNQKVPLLNATVYQLFPVVILLSGLIITVPILLVYFAVLLNKTNVAIDNLKIAFAETQTQLPQQPSPNMAFQPQI
ncbi:hypothetical protein BH20ACI1_BH20ACI1_04020 [soil metagenome]